MPGYVKGPTVTAVLPFSLCRAYSESQVYAARTNEYHDGSSQRAALVSTPRHSWKLTKRLSPTDIGTLRSFWLSNVASAFYFYNLKEGAHDPTGVLTTGRYVVRFDSDWQESTGIALSDSALALIEVANAVDVTNPIGAIKTITITVESSFRQPPDGDSPATVNIREDGIEDRDHTYHYNYEETGYPSYPRGSLTYQIYPLGGLGIPTVEELNALYLPFWIDGTLPWWAESQAEADSALLTVYDVYLTITYVSGFVQVYRPTTYVKVDGDRDTVSIDSPHKFKIFCWHTSGLSAYSTVTVSGFEVS